MMEPILVLVLAMCGVFLLVIPAIAYLLALLGNYLRRDTKTPDKMTRL